MTRVFFAASEKVICASVSSRLDCGDARVVIKEKYQHATANLEHCSEANHALWGEATVLPKSSPLSTGCLSISELILKIYVGLFV